MKTGSITYRLPAQADAYRQIPSVSCGTTSFRSFIVLLLIICCLGQFEKFCISVNIKQKKLHTSFAAQKNCLQFNTRYERHIYQNMYIIVNVYQPICAIFNPEALRRHTPEPRTTV